MVFKKIKKLVEISESLKNEGSYKYELAYRVGPKAGDNESRRRPLTIY